MYFNRTTIILVLTIIACLSSPIFAQTNLKSYILEDKLIESKFDNVAVLIDGKMIIATYENRIYRDENDALKKAIETLLTELDEETQLLLIPQFKRTPTTVVRILIKHAFNANHNNAYGNNIAVKPIVAFDIDFWWEKIKLLKFKNSSLFKTDLILNPNMKCYFGPYEDPFQSQLNIIPEITTNLWKGASLKAQFIYRLQNDLYFDYDQDNDWKFGILALNQFGRLPLNTFFSATIGHFSEDRYGIDTDVKKYFSDEGWALGGNIGYTGFVLYNENTEKWHYTNILKNGGLTGMGYVEYNENALDVSFRTSFVKTFEEKHWRIDTYRNFHEIQLGFFLVFDPENDKKSGGFNFSIPIFPSKYPANKYISVRPSRYFSWEYNYKSEPQGRIPYKTGFSINDRMKHFHPAYIKRNFYSH